MSYKRTIVFLFFVLLSLGTQAQVTVVTGTVIDNKTKETIPFAFVKFQDATKGVTTDLEGKFSLKGETKADSVLVESFGFELKAYPIKKGTSQYVLIELGESEMLLAEAVVSAGENPAWPIIRKTRENRAITDRANLDYYEYDSYNVLEVDVDNMSEKFKERKIMKPIGKSIENIEMLVDDKGREVFPMFISETLSKFYVKNNPYTNKEIISATRLSGLSTTDGSFASQFTGSTFQQFNFYANTITAFEREFMSPLGMAWKSNYKYELVDSLVDVNGHFSYEIAIQPRRPQDLAFIGTIWVDMEAYALTKMDVHIPKEANLNYIDGIEVKREWEPTPEGIWMPSETHLEVDIMELTKDWAGMIAKSHTSCENYVLNVEKPVDFYRYSIEVDENATNYDDQYWDDNRHGELNEQELASYAMIDTLKNLPVVRTYIDIVNIIVDGYKKVGKVELGSYLSAYAFNQVEGHRFRLGFKTHHTFSKKVEFSGYLAYGTLDNNWKYDLKTRLILSRRPWVELELETRRDIDQLGLTGQIGNPLFETFSRWGNVVGGYTHEHQRISLFKQLNKHFSGKVGLEHSYFNPLFDFAYFPNPNDQNQIRTRFTNSEAYIEGRFSKNEVILINDNDRLSFGSNQLPTFELRYAAGFNNVLGSDFDYHKLDLTISQVMGMGSLGKSRYWLRAGKVFNPVAYPLLNVHLGNQSPIYAVNSFNTMNYFEFVSDQYASLTFVHHFEGFFMNRIPLMKKLKWRIVTNAELLYGGVSQTNYNLIPNEQRPFRTLEKQPFVEVGYGIENIFKVVRVQLFHRLTYRDVPNAQKVGLKIGFQFSL